MLTGEYRCGERLPGVVSSVIERRLLPEDGGTVLAVLEAGEPYWVTSGLVPITGGVVDAAADTVLQLGSTTKVFTAMLLASMIESGELRGDEPVGDYLLREAPLVDVAGDPIRLCDLATHTAGISTLFAKAYYESGAHLSSDQCVDDTVKAFQPSSKRGERYEYCTLGFAWLAKALACRCGTSFEAALRLKVCEPLGLNDTWIVPPTTVRSRQVLENAKEDVGSRGRGPLLLGGTGLWSSSSDLTRVLRTLLGRGPKSASWAILSTAAARVRTGRANVSVAYGWHIKVVQNEEIVWHTGVRGCFVSYVGFTTTRDRGVALLSTSGSLARVADVGHWILGQV